jgi:putative DNA primase/helicase
MTDLTDKKNNVYELYSVYNYTKADSNFIEKEKIILDKKNLIKKLKEDNFYHFRIHNKTNYIFFGDLDNYPNSIENFIIILQKFLKKYYNLEFKSNEFKYTQNSDKKGSYHYSIPKWHASTSKLKEIHKNLSKIYQKEFIYKTEKIQKCIDTCIYSEHWFRCPNQSKGNLELEKGKNIHIIKEGKIDDFIINYIPKKSKNIESYKFFEKESLEKSDNETKETEIIEYESKNKALELSLYNDKDNNILSTTISKPVLYKKIFDECYNQERFEKYEYWISIGMAIKNTFIDDKEGFDLFNYYSSKGSNYEGYEKTKSKYMTFIKKINSNGITIATIHYYAIEDNKPKFIEIMSKNSFDLGQTDICKYIQIIAGNKFIYKKNLNNQYKLYCYNGKYWENDDIILRNWISSELYNFLKTILIEVYWNTKDFNIIKNKVEKLKTISFKKELIETYKELGLKNEIQFDEKWWLFGFTNKVYDMEEEIFRDYRYDDYVSITCGYDWREPTEDELETVKKLIEKIMPIENERNLFLQILCTAIEGRCLEKFILFNAGGRNGKGVINDLMLCALGNYGLLANNGILFENSKTGSNPEKANIHKKRYVVFREPPEKNKFENAVIKELTGGGTFSARTHQEKETEKDLNLTMVVECNKKPLFAEEPKDAEVHRIIDIFFRSTFTTELELLDDEKNIFLADPNLKTKNFQHKHKFALIKILIEEHKKFYKTNNSTLQIPHSIKERTSLYLEMSCTILEWFKENYTLIENDQTNIILISDIYKNFTDSMYWYNLSKTEKTKYSKKYFINYFQENILLKKYFKTRHSYKKVDYRNVLINWIQKQSDDE